MTISGWFADPCSGSARARPADSGVWAPMRVALVAGTIGPLRAAYVDRIREKRGGGAPVSSVRRSEEDSKCRRSDRPRPSPWRASGSLSLGSRENRRDKAAAGGRVASVRCRHARGHHEADHCARRGSGRGRAPDRNDTHPHQVPSGCRCSESPRAGTSRSATWMNPTRHQSARTTLAMLMDAIEVDPTVYVYATVIRVHQRQRAAHPGLSPRMEQLRHRRARSTTTESVHVRRQHSRSTRIIRSVDQCGVSGQCAGNFSRGSGSAGCPAQASKSGAVPQSVRRL